jgi:hypothetical protein
MTGFGQNEPKALPGLKGSLGARLAIVADRNERLLRVEAV